MESFAEQAGLFDVYTGKPDDTWNELFYSVVRFCFTSLRCTSSSKSSLAEIRLFDLVSILSDMSGSPCRSELFCQ